MRGRGNAHRIVIVNPVKKREFGKCRRKRENNIKPFLGTLSMALM
jgi:hypothetical protein